MTARELLRGIEQLSPLSEAFFHQSNIDLIQRAVIGKACKQTGFLIPKQDEQKVLIVMRSMYLQYSPDIPDHMGLKQQLRLLDQMVIDELLADIIPAIGMQSHYESMLDGPPTVIDRPVCTSRSGSNAVKQNIYQ